MLLLFTTYENCCYFRRTQLHHITHNAIIAQTSQDFEYTSQDIDHFRLTTKLLLGGTKS